VASLGRILVADDEPKIRSFVGRALNAAGYDADFADNGATALRAALENHYDLVILDLVMPEVDGRQALRELIAIRPRQPVIVLSCVGDVPAKVEMLELGAQDYLTKPFALAELIARVHAILRRTGYEPEDDGVLRFSDLELDESAHEVRRDGHVINLTATEFNLLRYFMLNPRHVLSKAQILDHVWHYDFGGDGNVVETYVSYLRKKLEKFGPPLIHTIRLVGYTLREPESAAGSGAASGAA